MAIRKTTVTEEIAAQPDADAIARQEEIARKDAAVMVGGPGLDAPPDKPESAPVTPQAQEYTIGGRKFSVDPELARSLEQRESDFNRKLNENSRELGELRKLVQPARQEPPVKGYDTLLFENPTEAVNRLKSEITAEVTSLYQQDKAQTDFWNGFYSKNQDLDRQDDDMLVRGVLQQNWNSLHALPPQEAAERLANLTRRQILRYSQKAKLEDESTPNPATRTFVEPASHPSPRPAPRAVDEGPATLTDVIKARRAARARGRAA